MEWQPIGLLLCLMAIDYIMGTIGHTMREGFQSARQREGLLHKLTYAVALVVCVIVEQIMSYIDLPMIYAGLMFSLCYVWIALTEIGSILENLLLINPDLGDKNFLKIFDRRSQDEQPTQPLPVIEVDEGGKVTANE